MKRVEVTIPKQTKIDRKNFENKETYACILWLLLAPDLQVYKSFSRSTMHDCHGLWWNPVCYYRGMEPTTYFIRWQNCFNSSKTSPNCSFFTFFQTSGHLTAPCNLMNEFLYDCENRNYSKVIIIIIMFMYVCMYFVYIMLCVCMHMQIGIKYFV